MHERELFLAVSWFHSGCFRRAAWFLQSNATPTYCRIQTPALQHIISRRSHNHLTFTVRSSSLNLRKSVCHDTVRSYRASINFSFTVLIKSSWKIHLQETVYSVHQSSVSQTEIIDNWRINVRPVQWSTDTVFLVRLLLVFLV